MATITVKRSVEVKYLQVECGVRYWEDGYVDGVRDMIGSLIPLREGTFADNTPLGGGDWCPTIDLDTGKIENWPQGTTADLNYKVCDAGVYTLLDADGKVVVSINGYVPAIMCPGDTPDGDYVCMTIGADGTIANWRVDLAAFEAQREQG